MNSINFKHCLITCGPTKEYIDEVRYISNKATGIFGSILAEEAEMRGYKAHIISGSSNVIYPSTTIVDTTSELLNECKKRIKSMDVLIMNSAVCDYKPFKQQKGKIKKRKTLNLKLRENIDVLKELGKLKQEGQLYIGFALEPEKEGIKNAKRKLHNKPLDLIVLNYLGSFGGNKISGAIIRKGSTIRFYNQSKPKVAQMIFDEINRLYYKTNALQSY